MCISEALKSNFMRTALISHLFLYRVRGISNLTSNPDLRFLLFVYSFDDELLRNYLPLDRVLSGLFSLCSRLFGIRIQEVKEFDSWHPDVKFYYIYEPDSEKPVAGFYLDPYLRSV